MLTCDSRGCSGSACRGCRTCNCACDWFARPSGEVVDSALVMERSVGCKVRLDSSIVVTCAKQLVANVVYDAIDAEKIGLVRCKIVLYRGAKEGVVCCGVARAGEADAGQIASEDLLLEAVDGVWDTFEVLEDSHFFGYRCAGAMRALG